uniref:Uncharacterized protein n=1 Tax=Kalanchoe fedtschenkoi TaxID=63787 RepID=A0A7N0TRW0_KALFE
MSLIAGQAGIFHRADPAPVVTATAKVVERHNGGVRREEAVEISSDNSGPSCRSRSDDDIGFEGEGNDEDDVNEQRKKKRKKYHRHTAEQIREMEALFKESPHPDEKQRQDLSKQLGLSSRQVKFWFQNRRTQIKAFQERHENSLLKSEMEKLREENKLMRETIQKTCCPSCGISTSGKESSSSTEEKYLRIENKRLKSEVENLQSALSKYSGPGTGLPDSGHAEQEPKSSLGLSTSAEVLGLQKSTIMNIANHAVEELIQMATVGAPLWVQSVEAGREILNYDVYMKLFCKETDTFSSLRPTEAIEASRDTRLVFANLPQLAQSFMDADKWKELFPTMISKATTIDIIRNGEGPSRNGAVQLMFAELQMLTPMVPSREVYFIRSCKQLSASQWAIVDVSVDKYMDNAESLFKKCSKRPSGCIIEDTSNGHCKVIWVEHLECQKIPVHNIYRTIVNSGQAFGASRWMATLQLQCEHLVFLKATNVPTKEANGIATVVGRKSTLTLARRMSSSFCRALGASSHHTWTKVASTTGDDIRVSSRKNLHNPGEPHGLIVCAVSSVWIPVPPRELFDFIRDERHRHEWDMLSNGVPVQSITNLAKGQDRGNSVTIQATESKDNPIWVLQDTCTNTFESTIVYGLVDPTHMRSAVMNGCNSSNTAILPSGFSILSDGLESRPSVITSQPEDSNSGGSLLTMAIQALVNTSPTAEAVDSVSTLVSCALSNIRKCLQCEDI